MSTLVAEHLNEKELYAEYQDPINGAIFTLSCPIKDDVNASKACDATLEGTFRIGNEEYRMSVMENNALSRMRRAVDLGSLWRRAKKLARAATALSKVYGIYKTESTPFTPTDFKVEEPIIRGRVAEALTTEPRLLRENVLPGDRKYNVEVLAVLDYGLYERFYKASKLPTESERDNEAKYNLKKYFSHVFNGVDMLYKNIDDVDFTMSVGVSGFVIADSPEASVWTTPHIDRTSDRHELLVSTPLEELLRWSVAVRNLPENDHIMLLTDYDLYSVDSGAIDKRTAGYARVGSVCHIDSVSVVEDHGGFQGINAAAHELGHGLGGRHDGVSNACDPADQYIMTAHGGFESASTRTNPWRFSSCSMNYFKQYISTLPRANCLTDPVNLFDRTEFLQYVEQYPGQDFTPNEQCQDILGLDSFYGWGQELGTFSSICSEMSCKVPGSASSYRVYKAATGTSCGDKRWCINGACVFDEKAPTKDPECVFGDIERRFGSNQSCREYMIERPMRCYQSFYSARCCDTCARLHTGVADCEYGDQALGCDPQGCFDPSYARQCCSTCGLAPQPVVRNLNVTTTLTSTTSAATTSTTRKPTTPRNAPITSTLSPTNPRTTSRPVTSTTKPTTSSPKPSASTSRTFNSGEVIVVGNADLTPSGSGGQCLRNDDTIMLIFKCSTFLSLSCDNFLVKRSCCEKCPAPGNQFCKDEAICPVNYARECYSEQNRKQCCRSCQKFETSVSGCEYGDRIRNCDYYVRVLGYSEVCKKYASHCCGVCGNNSSTALSNQQSQGRNAASTAVAVEAKSNIVSDATGLSEANSIPVPLNDNGKVRGRGKDKGQGISKENPKKINKQDQANDINTNTILFGTSRIPSNTVLVRRGPRRSRQGLTFVLNSPEQRQSAFDSLISMVANVAG
ncbi:uncharacterized protein LOC127866424 [Dreissena polymorpha]|nr:uncharacterized protein LOC127866424 [Dreissena polymorpha]